jgi:hypothetical protein
MTDEEFQGMSFAHGLNESPFNVPYQKSFFIVHKRKTSFIREEPALNRDFIPDSPNPRIQTLTMEIRTFFFKEFISATDNMFVMSDSKSVG